MIEQLKQLADKHVNSDCFLTESNVDAIKDIADQLPDPPSDESSKGSTRKMAKKAVTAVASMLFLLIAITAAAFVGWRLHFNDRAQIATQQAELSQARETVTKQNEELQDKKKTIDLVAQFQRSLQLLSKENIERNSLETSLLNLEQANNTLQSLTSNPSIPTERPKQELWKVCEDLFYHYNSQAFVWNNGSLAIPEGANIEDAANSREQRNKLLARFRDLGIRVPLPMECGAQMLNAASLLLEGDRALAEQELRATESKFRTYLASADAPNENYVLMVYFLLLVEFEEFDKANDFYARTESSTRLRWRIQSTPAIYESLMAAGNEEEAFNSLVDGLHLLRATNQTARADAGFMSFELVKNVRLGRTGGKKVVDVVETMLLANSILEETNNSDRGVVATTTYQILHEAGFGDFADRNLPEFDNSVQAEFFQANLHYQNSEYQKAVDIYERLIEGGELGDKEKLARNNLLMAKLRLGASEDLIVDVEELLQNFNEDNDKEFLANVYDTVGQVLFAESKYEDAGRYFSKAIELVNDKSVELGVAAKLKIRSNYATNQFRLGNVDVALEEFEAQRVAATQYYGTRRSLVVAAIENNLAVLLQKIPSRKIEGQEMLVEAKQMLGPWLKFQGKQYLVENQMIILAS